MTGSSRTSNEPEHRSQSGDDSEDESEILEESPCGRWLKRREEVEQRNVPGIDCAHLAMDTEEGVEVVWNEVQFSQRRDFKSQEEKIQQVFENLAQLEHPNIVKLHRYWTDTHNDKPRVIFITEYMSSGSLKQFLKRTKRNVKRLPLQTWRRWCTQILSALSYLHSCSPPIIHGNLNCDTIFIQHNGLVKIGSVAPDAIHHHVKTCREDNMRNIHFIAPEYSDNQTPAIDVYSFGMCALEMAGLELQGNGDSVTLVTEEMIARAIDGLDDAQQRDFILKCLKKDPAERDSARQLLFHPLLFEVHSLKLLAAHCLVALAPSFSEALIEEAMQRLCDPDLILAEIHRENQSIEMKLADLPSNEKLEKFVEDVKFGIYPLTAFPPRQPPPLRPITLSPEPTESVKSATPEPLDIETRKVVNMICSVKPRDDSCDLMMTILLRMDDKMNRQLTCQISQEDTASRLSDELVHLGFINDTDREKITLLIEDTLSSYFSKINKALQQEVDQHQMQMPINSASIERHWTVADCNSPGGGITSGGPSTPTTMPPAIAAPSLDIPNCGQKQQRAAQQTESPADGQIAKNAMTLPTRSGGDMKVNYCTTTAPIANTVPAAPRGTD
ncbi:Nuclear receptor-binding protein homolog [Sergentomyia squamirostris]